MAYWDPHLKDPSYELNKWFHLDAVEWPTHTRSRVHDISPPWNLAPTVCPIPEIINNNLDFNSVMDSVASRQCKEIDQLGLTPYLSWSGGIDSTAILVSILRNASREFLEKLVILHDHKSIKENAYFFSRFIDGKLQCQDINTFVLDSSNFDKIVILDGEAGNQVMGWRAINILRYYDRLDLFATPWRTHNNLTELLPGSSQFTIDLVVESIKHAPIDIITCYDFIWWANFNFKVDEVLLRKAINMTNKLTAEQCCIFYSQGLRRFFVDPEMQIWSMISSDLRREKTNVFSKYFPKKYIFEFDDNELYYSNKREEASNSDSALKSSNGLSPICAVDSNWNKYSMANKADRKQFGQILKRI